MHPHWINLMISWINFTKNLHNLYLKYGRANRFCCWATLMRVGRDFEAWPNVLRRHGIGNMNANGQLLLSFCAQFDLSITNNLFPTSYETQSHLDASAIIALASHRLRYCAATRYWSSTRNARYAWCELLDWPSTCVNEAKAVSPLSP